MKHILFLLALALTLCMLSACGGGDPEDDDSVRQTIGTPDCSAGACK